MQQLPWSVGTFSRLFELLMSISESAPQVLWMWLDFSRCSILYCIGHHRCIKTMTNVHEKLTTKSGYWNEQWSWWRLYLHYLWTRNNRGALTESLGLLVHRCFCGNQSIIPPRQQICFNWKENKPRWRIYLGGGLVEKSVISHWMKWHYKANDLESPGSSSDLFQLWGNNKKLSASICFADFDCNFEMAGQLQLINKLRERFSFINTEY